MKFPNDEDGQVLNELYKYGLDFNSKHKVDFFIVIPDKLVGEKISKLVSKEDFEILISMDEDGGWSCCCQKTIYLTYENVVNIQEYLDEVSSPFGGILDGWGVIMEE
ncbi:ribonuclease E inhibitor RraB [Niallia sp. 03133]|uniref:ribonuclease E inhibitor RraB n=1 Tax=Niallia sp. 03133 TaxID=3458060 RepID=UPI00404437AF